MCRKASARKPRADQADRCARRRSAAAHCRGQLWLDPYPAFSKAALPRRDGWMSLLPPDICLSWRAKSNEAGDGCVSPGCSAKTSSVWTGRRPSYCMRDIRPEWGRNAAILCLRRRCLSIRRWNGSGAATRCRGSRRAVHSPARQSAHKRCSVLAVWRKATLRKAQKKVRPSYRGAERIRRRGLHRAQRRLWLALPGSILVLKGTRHHMWKVDSRC